MRAGGIYLAINRFIRSQGRSCFSLRRFKTFCHSRHTALRKAPMAGLFVDTPYYRKDWERIGDRSIVHMAVFTGMGSVSVEPSDQRKT
jgi:hypothetical protein